LNGTAVVHTNFLGVIGIDQLQNCASTSDKFYLLTSADQMTATFNTIGTNLTKLRVAQ
jgi:hypothetical protein